MTEITEQWRKCGRKRQYRSRKAALNTGKTLHRECGETKKLRAYECPHCGGWHLTSKD